MNGTLYLIPHALGPGALDSVIPAPVRKVTSDLDYFIAENAKTARAFLKRIGETHPLCKAMQDIEIRELNVKTAQADIPVLLAPLL